MALAARIAGVSLVMLAVIILLSASAPVLAQAQPVVEISVAGNQRISTEAIEGAIESVTGLKPGQAYTEAAVNAAKQAIQNMGYFERVIAGVEPVDNGVRVVFSVTENPVIKAIAITGNTVVPTEKLLSLMLTKVGSVVNTNTLRDRDIPAIERYYAELGYIALVAEDVGVNPQTGVLTIPVIETRVQEIRITGNKKTKTHVVTREMSLKPGDLYNQKVLIRDINRIYDLGIFELENVAPYTLEPGSEIGQVIVVIPVKEKKTGELTLGLAYSSSQKLVGQVKFSENNLGGRADTISALWEQSASRGASYELSYFEPWLDKHHTSMNVSLYNRLTYRFSSSVLGSSLSEDDANDYDERHKGGAITISRPLGLYNRGAITVRSESVETRVGDETTIPAEIIQNGTVQSVTGRYTRSTRDTVTAPFTGSYSSYAVEVGRADVEMGDSTFSKYSLDLRRYLSKGGPRTSANEKRTVIAARLLAGTLSGDVPFFEQYFLGGADTLRGYREDRFWGKHMVLGSLEYRQPLASSLVGVLFVDYGDAWGAKTAFLDVFPDAELVQHEGFSPNLGYGVGIRVVTPIGPLRLDYGFGSEGSKASFSIGNTF